MEEKHKLSYPPNQEIKGGFPWARISIEAQLLYDLAQLGIGFQAPDPNNILDNLYKEYGRAVVK